MNSPIDIASTPVHLRLFRSRAAGCYVAGLALLTSTLLLTDALNPRGVRDGSWFEPFSIPLAALSLLLCVIAPFLSPRPLLGRFGLLAFGLVGFFFVAGATWLISARVFGASLF